MRQSHSGSVFLSSWRTENFGLFWPLWAILLRIHALFGVFFTDLIKCGSEPKMTNIRYWESNESLVSKGGSWSKKSLDAEVIVIIVTRIQ